MENEELLQELDTTVTFIDENGEEIEFEYLGSVDYEGKEYLALLPAGSDELVFMEVEPVDEENEDFLLVEDEDTLDAVYQIFKENFKDLLDFAD